MILKDKLNVIAGEKSFIALFLVAVFLRLLYLADVQVDYYGDSYHNWLISYLTAVNGYVYTDFKLRSMNIIWLPLYYYVNAFFMNLTGTYGLTVPHAVNIVMGSLTCVIVYGIARKLFENRLMALTAGLCLAFQPWFIDVNCLAVTETICIFFIILALYHYIGGKTIFFIASVALSMLARYEGWVFAAIFLLAAIFQKRLAVKEFFLYIICCGSVVFLWSIWSYVNAGDFIAWYNVQTSMLYWDIRFFRRNILELVKILWSDIAAVAITSSLILIGIIAGLVRREINFKALALMELAYTFYMSIPFLTSTILFESRHIAYLFPFTAILSPIILLKVNQKDLPLKKALLAVCLLSLILIPYFGQIGIFPRKTYIIEPEMRTGLAIKRVYVNGTVICDSPAIIYYSQLPPKLFYSSDRLLWYSETWNKTLLKNWIKQHKVQYMVWQNASYSTVWWLFPELSDGRSRVIQGITYTPIYARVDILVDRTTIIYIYKITLSQMENGA